MVSTYDVLHSYGFYKYKYTHFLLLKFAMKMYQTVLCRLSHLILANQKPTDNQGVHSLTSTKEVKLHSFDSFLKLSGNFSEAPFSVIWKAIYERTKDKNTQKSYVHKYTCVQLVLRLMTLLCEGCGLFEMFSNQSQLLGFTSPGWHHWTGSLDPVCEYDHFDSKRNANAEPNLKALK